VPWPCLAQPPPNRRLGEHELKTLAEIVEYGLSFQLPRNDELDVAHGGRRRPGHDVSHVLGRLNQTGRNRRKEISQAGSAAFQYGEVMLDIRRTGC
jgi:hypothetical protein